VAVKGSGSWRSYSCGRDGSGWFCRGPELWGAYNLAAKRNANRLMAEADAEDGKFSSRSLS